MGWGGKMGGVLTPFLAPGVRPIWQRWDGNFHQSADPQIGGRGETAQGTPPPWGQQVSVGSGVAVPPPGRPPVPTSSSCVQRRAGIRPRRPIGGCEPGSAGSLCTDPAGGGKGEEGAVAAGTPGGGGGGAAGDTGGRGDCGDLGIGGSWGRWEPLGMGSLGTP